MCSLATLYIVTQLCPFLERIASLEATFSVRESHLRQILGISQFYLRLISGISSQVCLRYISGIFQVYIR